LLAIGEAVAVLERTPRALGGLLEGLSDQWARFSPSEGSWSAYDIVGHLIHGEKTDWMPRVAMILEHGASRPFEAFDREAMFEASAGEELGALLAEFASLREQGLRDLAGLHLGEAELALEGLHPSLGRVKLAQLIASWAVHDLGHLAQTGEAMAKRYRAEVGPWRAFLPVVDRPDPIGD
jgi:DinB family protein